MGGSPVVMCAVESSICSVQGCTLENLTVGAGRGLLVPTRANVKGNHSWFRLNGGFHNRELKLSIC
jgi:hypothetical protein